MNLRAALSAQFQKIQSVKEENKELEDLHHKLLCFGMRSKRTYQEVYTDSAYVRMLLIRTGACSSSQTEFLDHVHKCILQEEEKLSKETIETKPTSTATKSARAVKEEPVEEKKTSTISIVKNNVKGTLKMATPVAEEVESDYVKVIELQEHVSELVTVVGTLLTRMHCVWKSKLILLNRTE
jgi:hypothetical protein